MATATTTTTTTAGAGKADVPQRLPAQPKRGERDPTIARLAQRAAAGSLESFAALARRFEGRLYNFLLRRTGSAADAEEIAQEALLAAWRHVDRYDARWAFSTWLFTIARRAAAAYVRRRRREAPLPAAAAAADDGHGPLRRLADREQGELLWDAADRLLTDAERTVLWLRYAEDMPIGDIARVAGRSRVAVRVSLFRAREKLAAHLRGRNAASAAGPPRREAPREPAAALREPLRGEVPW